MRIHVLSDLHLECYEQPSELPTVAADLVVLAGDIHRAAEGMAWAATQFPAQPVIYVPGNHEYYGGSMAERRQQLVEAAQQHGILLLDNDVRVLDGVRFLGCTLWADFALYEQCGQAPAEAMQLAAQRVPDFRLISCDEAQSFSPAQAQALHRETVRWLETELSQPFAGPTVVISHHAPLAACIPEQYRGDPLSPAFASGLDHLMGQAELWIHGHVHEPVDIDCNGTRVVANPGGYPGEFSPPLFDGARWVEV